MGYFFSLNITFCSYYTILYGIRGIHIAIVSERANDSGVAVLSPVVYSSVV